MPTKEIVADTAAKIAEGLRTVAHLVEEHDWIGSALLHPRQPILIYLHAEDADDVRLWAQVTGSPVTEHVAADGKLHTVAVNEAAGVRLEVVHIGAAPRELRRPVAVTPRLEAVHAA